MLIDIDEEHYTIGSNIQHNKGEWGLMYVLARPDMFIIRILYVFPASKGMEALLLVAVPYWTRSAEG
jgi:hypothetical protein